ncbi:hypothetical protein AGMMS50229_02110 [Campylobacterota bacterium]|nr:hypothetical protein AGMMS50229_02110 [Campylobacterota bacterium]
MDNQSRIKKHKKGQKIVNMDYLVILNAPLVILNKVKNLTVEILQSLRSLRMTGLDMFQSLRSLRMTEKYHITAQNAAICSFAFASSCIT